MKNLKYIAIAAALPTLWVLWALSDVLWALSDVHGIETCSHEGKEWGWMLPLMIAALLWPVAGVAFEAGKAAGSNASVADGETNDKG